MVFILFRAFISFTSPFTRVTVRPAFSLFTPGVSSLPPPLPLSISDVSFPLKGAVYCQRQQPEKHQLYSTGIQEQRWRWSGWRGGEQTTSTHTHTHLWQARYMSRCHDDYSFIHVFFFFCKFWIKHKFVWLSNSTKFKRLPRSPYFLFYFFVSIFLHNAENTFILNMNIGVRLQSIILV